MLRAGRLRSPPLSPLRHEDHGTTTQVGGASWSHEERNLFVHGPPLEGTQRLASVDIGSSASRPHGPSGSATPLLIGKEAPLRGMGLGSTIHRRDPLIIAEWKSAEGQGLATIDREPSDHADAAVRTARRSKYGSCRPLGRYP
jgi:hypothetical protein